LFFNSQTEPEQRHIISAFAFELSKVTVPAVRERIVSMLRNVSEVLASGVAGGLGMALPEPMPLAIANPPTPEVQTSPALSLMARPGDGRIATRKIAVLVADDIAGATTQAVADALIAAGAVVRLVGSRIGPCTADDGLVLDADATLENSPSPLFDGMVIPDGAVGMEAL